MDESAHKREKHNCLRNPGRFKALAAQGFAGGTKQETEWNQWVASEKEQLAKVMEYHGIQWLRLGTHEKHLSVLDYEKKVRSEEVSVLETKIDGLQDVAKGAQKSADEIFARLEHLRKHDNLIDLNVGKYDSDLKWQLPEPTTFMTANTYKSKLIEPFIKKLKGVIRSLVAQYLELVKTVDDLKNRLARVYADTDRLVESIRETKRDNSSLVEIAKDYKRVRDTLGAEHTDSIIATAKWTEQSRKHSERFSRRDRGR